MNCFAVSVAIPVVDPSMNLLPLHFSYDPGKEFDWMQPSKQPSEKRVRGFFFFG